MQRYPIHSTSPHLIPQSSMCGQALGINGGRQTVFKKKITTPRIMLHTVQRTIAEREAQQVTLRTIANKWNEPSPLITIYVEK